MTAFEGRQVHLAPVGATNACTLQREVPSVSKAGLCKVTVHDEFHQVAITHEWEIPPQASEIPVGVRRAMMMAQGDSNARFRDAGEDTVLTRNITPPTPRTRHLSKLICSATVGGGKHRTTSLWKGIDEIFPEKKKTPVWLAGPPWVL